MPGNKPHHTDKWRSCVDKVMGEGHDESSASAICTTSLQKAGEAIFEGAASRSAEESTFLQEFGVVVQVKAARHLHLLGATGESRTEMIGKKEYLVIPIVALMEGVIHPVNAETPEFVPFKTLQKAAASWNGRPVTLGHPVKNGKQCSASDPIILESHGLGFIRNSVADAASKKMLQEACVEKAQAKKLHPVLYANLEANKPQEVSVGAFVLTDDKPGSHGEKRFNASWVEATGDHLAFLPDRRGACSIEMGCGTHRAAMHFVTAEGLDVRPLEERALDMPGCVAFTTLADQSLDERIRAVNDAVYKKWNTQAGTLATGMPSEYAYAKQVFDDSVIVERGTKIYALPYDVADDGTVTLGDETEVKVTYVAAAVADNPRALAGARHSAADTKMIQSVHDHAAALGANCGPKLREAHEGCTCGGNKNLKAASIRHEGGKYVLYSTDGSRKLGEHFTIGSAEEQHQAIQRSLARQGAK